MLQDLAQRGGLTAVALQDNFSDAQLRQLAGAAGLTVALSQDKSNVAQMLAREVTERRPQPVVPRRQQDSDQDDDDSDGDEAAATRGPNRGNGGLIGGAGAREDSLPVDGGAAMEEESQPPETQDASGDDEDGSGEDDDVVGGDGDMTSMDEDAGSEGESEASGGEDAADGNTGERLVDGCQATGSQTRGSMDYGTTDEASDEGSEDDGEASEEEDWQMTGDSAASQDQVEETMDDGGWSPRSETSEDDGASVEEEDGSLAGDSAARAEREGSTVDNGESGEVEDDPAADDEEASREEDESAEETGATGGALGPSAANAAGDPSVGQVHSTMPQLEVEVPAAAGVTGQLAGANRTAEPPTGEEGDMDASHGLEGDDAEDVTGAMAEAGGNETPLSDGERACGDGRCKRCSTSSPDSLAKGAFLRHGCPSKKWVQWYIKALLRQCTFGEAFAADKLRQRKAVSEHVPVALEPTLQHGTMAAAASLAGAGRRGNAEGHPTVEQAAGIRVQLTTVAALKAYLRRQNGTSAKDLAKSMASAGTVAQDRETLEALMNLHPSEEEVVDGTVEGEAPDLTDSELREMVSAAIQSMPHKKAVGPDGMVAKQLENIAEKDLDALVSFVRRALRNDLSAEERRVLGSSTLMAIPKGNGKIRPVAMVSGLGKLVGKVVNTILGKHGLLDQLRFQFLGCRDGSCRLVHAVRTAFEEGEIRTVVVALDMANAYNSVSRRAMIEEVRRLDEKLVPAVLALYGSSSPLLFATDEGEVFELESNRGVRQGDPAAGALFAIAVHPLVDEVRRAFPDVLILQMADDTTLVGPRRSAFKAAQMLAERLSTVGLRMNTSKTQVLCKRGQLERTKARIQREMKRSRDDPGSPPSVLEGCHLTERSVAVLQCPVGEELPPEVALEHSMKRLEKEFGPAAERLLAGIEVCGLKRAHHLLLSVVGQKFSYLHRAAGAAAGQELAVFHAALLANLSAVAHKTELDAIGHALSDEMCTVTEDGFREAMSKAIEALVRGLPDEHARREAWWALLGREADGVTRLASAASNPALKKGGYAQMRLAKMLSKGCKAGGMGLPGVAQFRFEATAGFIEAVRDMRKGRFEMAPPPEEALDGPGTGGGGGEAASGSGAGAGPANAGEAEAEDESGAAAAAAGGTPWVDHPAVGESESKEDCEEGPAHGQQLADRSDATKEVGDILLRCEEVAKGAYRDYERDSKEYKDACTEARYFRPDKDCVVGKEADLHAARVKKRYQLAHVWRSDIAGAVEGLEELRAEIEELALEAMMELRSDDESSDDMEATANLVEEFIRACKGARCLAAATGFEGFLPDTLGKLPGELKAKLRKCLYGDGVTARANEQTEAPWQRKMVLHHDDMLRIKHECVFLRRLAKARRACTARCRAEALAKGTPEKRVANIDDPAMLRVMSDLVAFREACVPGTHYWLRNTMMGPRGLTDEEFAVVERYRIGASEADHVVPDGVSINCACVQRDTTARGTVHIGGVSGVAHHLARCRCGKGSTIRAHNDVRDVLHAAVYSVRRTPAIGLARDGPDADADGNDPNWKGISLKKLVRSSLKRSDRSDATKEVGDILLRCEEVAKGAYRDYERDSKEYKDACTEARYFRPDKDCVVGKEADLHAARVKKRYQLAHVWRSDIAGAVEGLEELRAEIEELALEAMMELRSDDESSDDMEATANLVEEFIRACKGARCLAAATGFEGFLPDTLGKLPGELKAKLRKCLYGDGVTARANEQTEAPWQRKMVLHHDDMLRIKHECVFLRRLAKARRACTARCRAEALAKGTPEKRVANIDDPAMLRVMSDLVAFREACVPGTHYWLRNTMMGPRGLTDEEFAVVERYRIGASEADHVVPDGVSINCASPRR
ncbi:hypothetical protein FNF31_07809 [Cafeteria roenbergensis]|uniref:Reverse transcriptase domain-containing protein n=1 Tax=Cafeteria roenbergensis TaxID=33653 RepID=A0A5A8C002_CAFRO|nr:hypothetical protein FNF31_07809 [Cafeteria roenbergensis]